MEGVRSIRRWLWRGNAALAVLAVVAWAGAFGRPDPEPWTPPPAPRAEPPPVRTGPDVPWEEAQALCRRFHGWGEYHPAPPPKPETRPEGPLPLRALRLACWLKNPAGPDTIVLKSKDPAHPETYLPMEGTSDHGVEIVAIREGDGAVRFDVRRGSEEWTFEMARPGSAGTSRRGTVATRGPGRGGGSGSGGRSSRGTTPPDVKVVDFYGPDGHVLGARVTGVRPGSRLAVAGLQRGDVVSRANGTTVVSARDLRERLASGEAIAALDVQRGGNAAPVEIAVGR